MKRMAAIWAIVVLLMGCALPAFASDYRMVTDCLYAPVYDSYRSGSRQVIGYVPSGEEVYCIAVLDSCSYVAYQTLAGYIDEAFLTWSSGISFTLPGGMQDAPASGTGIPAFSCMPVSAKANQKLATRSGPGTEYTDTLTYPQSTELVAFYQTGGSGTQWAYIEFRYQGEWYRLYTGAKRLNTSDVLPYVQEMQTSVTIRGNLYPYYGPGYVYAQSDICVPSGAWVQACFGENGWIMFDYATEGGKLLRGWAPPDSWY